MFDTKTPTIGQETIFGQFEKAKAEARYMHISRRFCRDGVRCEVTSDATWEDFSSMFDDFRERKITIPLDAVRDYGSFILSHDLRVAKAA